MSELYYQEELMSRRNVLEGQEPYELLNIRQMLIAQRDAIEADIAMVEDVLSGNGVEIFRKKDS